MYTPPPVPHLVTYYRDGKALGNGTPERHTTCSSALDAAHLAVASRTERVSRRDGYKTVAPWATCAYVWIPWEDKGTYEVFRVEADEKWLVA